MRPESESAREAAEDDGVRRAEPRAREHRDRQLGNHAHVDRDRRPLLHAELLQRVREADDVALQLRVGDRARARPPARPPSGRRPCRRCPASTCRSTQLKQTLSVPPRNHFAYGGSHSYSLANGSNHVSRSRALALPERLERLVVDLRLRVRLRGELRRRRIAPLLEEHRLDRVARVMAPARTGSR